MSSTPEKKAIHLQSLAVFLDVDGTLLEIAPTPDAVYVGPRLRSLLELLYPQPDGALALVSGRTIANLDELFAPMAPLPAAGLHGFERRTATGARVHCAPPDEETLALARADLQTIAARYPGTLVEDKQVALAMHYRLAQESATEILSHMELLAARVRPHLHLQPGKMVAELRPAKATKGEAIREFLREPPFSDRLPIFIGDDLTDETAFEAVNAVGGVSVAVNVQRPTAARFYLPNVSAVHDWLESLPAGLSTTAGALSVVLQETTQLVPPSF
jgi:trehalose 6-phosphate phosphatase